MAKQCFTALRVISWLRAKADPPYDAAQEAQFRDQVSSCDRYGGGLPVCALGIPRAINSVGPMHACRRRR